MSHNYSTENGKEDDADFVKYEQNFKDEIFKELTKSLDAKECAQAMFIQKFERLDTNFLNSIDVSIYYSR